jgi:hypothetical protein
MRVTYMIRAHGAFGMVVVLFGSVALGSMVASCGLGEDPELLISSSNGASAATTTTTVGAGGGASSGGNGGEGQGGSSTSTGVGGMGAGGGPAIAADPNKDGPYQFTEMNDSITVQATGAKVPIHCAFPTAGPQAGPYPVVVVAHGLSLGADLYVSYVKRLASFGYVALTADYPASIFNVNNTNNAKELLAALDWAEKKAELAGKADVSQAGMTGHSLGGKLALFAATMDPRVKASINLDPVDGGMGQCNEPSCVDMSAKMKTLTIPTGFLGETLDATGMFGQACAPTANNYDTFYVEANAPSLKVTVTGASHMSFLDNPSCGFTCNACQKETAPLGTVNAMARAYVVAFYERHLRGNIAYDSYLTGADAKVRYVDTGMATITSK